MGAASSSDVSEEELVAFRDLREYYDEIAQLPADQRPSDAKILGELRSVTRHTPAHGRPVFLIVRVLRRVGLKVRWVQTMSRSWIWTI
jgi:hypothetical protein